MQKETQLQRNVLAELDWDPKIDAARVGVTVAHGVITLTGTVMTFADRLTADKIVKRVTGVKAVANDLQVELPAEARRSDTDLATAAVRALEWDVRIPPDRVKVAVENGWITLEGELEWNFEREAAGKAVRRLTGVLGVTDLITLGPPIEAGDVKARIRAALLRKAELDASHIEVHVHGADVTLTGTVRSWTEREDAEHASWAAKGVGRVDNRIAVEPEIVTGLAG